MLILALPATIPCKLCLPCITPPCYKQEPGVSYTTNAPGDSYGGDSSSCWRQRLLTPHKVPGAGGTTGELCGCPADWSEYESYRSHVDALGRQVWGTLHYRHKHCSPLAAQPILWAGDDDARSMVGGQAETFSCSCRTRGVRVRLHEDEALAITPVPSAPFAGVPGDTIMTHLTHFVQFDAHAPRLASGFYVLLANGTREYVDPPNATLANATASNATASNATAALPRLLPRRTLGPA
jgi:hypothetical protein